jgi:hypothetical protein
LAKPLVPIKSGPHTYECKDNVAYPLTVAYPLIMLRVCPIYRQ